jgi:hypothetical protein
VPPLAHVFGVRHFSAAAAVHLRRFLEEVDPAVILIEGPSDATDLLKHLADRRTVPPVALLAFTKTRPVRSILYPMASYCAEWVALRFALERKRAVRLIDLPALAFLSVREPEKEVHEADDTRAYLDDPWQEIARLSGDPDHETWWERQFEHTAEVAAYRDAIFEFGRGLRDVRKDPPQRERETLLREAHMRREIRAAVKDPSKAVVVCGAYHAPVLTDELPPMSDEEAKALPKADIVLTLMPYSYPRLSSQSGYGAGNHAPAYFQALYEETVGGRAERIRARYVGSVAAHLRKEGLVRSSAEVIEGVRLAEGLASLNDSPAPVLRDLRDAVVTLLGHGERAPLEKALREVEIGSAVGRLPPGVSRTALQDDFHHLLLALRLDKYLKDQDQDLELDLRENRFVKSKDAAFLDRNRSTFLHRLDVLQVGFGKTSRREQKGTAKEKWSLRWTPECEIRLAECSLESDSIEAGAAFALSRQLAEAKDVGEATSVLLRAANAELADSVAASLRRVQAMAVEEGGFVSASAGIENLTELIRYGNVRDVDPAPLRPVLSQLYLRAVHLLHGACVCDDDAAKLVRAAMDRVQECAFLGEEGMDPALWLGALRPVSESDDRNPFLSGYATALLLERGAVEDAALDAAVSRRLSPGTEAETGVGWFEGLVQRNRTVLFMRKALWSALAGYVDPLGDDEFRKALLYLRRAFSTFEPAEIRRVTGCLAEAWKGEGAGDLQREVERKLDADEIKKATDDLQGLDLI